MHNYAIEQSPSHHLYAVERGLRILENPMAQVSAFAFKKNPGARPGQMIMENILRLQ